LFLIVAANLNRHAWGETLVLAERHLLTPYDAAYLKLAMRRNLPLATLDEDLRQAGRSEKIPLLGN
jgi:predicted nucleic acid-binding protein